jgi:hypothetical protein
MVGAAYLLEVEPVKLKPFTWTRFFEVGDRRLKVVFSATPTAETKGAVVVCHVKVTEVEWV